MNGDLPYDMSQCSVPESWADPACLLTQFPDLDPIDAEGAIQAASWALWALTGRKLHGYQQRIDEMEVYGCDLRFPVGPVDSIVSIEQVDPCGTGSPTTMGDWCPSGPQSVNLCGGSYYGGFVGDYRTNQWGPCNRPSRVRATYNVCSNLPPGTDKIVCSLASEYVKASTGAPGCKLPERITSITRQGVSWTVLDPQGFFDAGRTGIVAIDHWITAVRVGVGSATLIDPLRGRVITSQITTPGAVVDTVTLRPKTVNIAGYAGDTLTIRIHVSDPEYVAGAVWTAQVRDDHAGPVVATFNVVMEDAQTAILTLAAEDTAELGVFSGVWDVQAAQDPDPVRTLAQGAVTLAADVTRAVAP